VTMGRVKPAPEMTGEGGKVGKRSLSKALIGYGKKTTDEIFFQRSMGRQSSKEEALKKKTWGGGDSHTI